MFIIEDYKSRKLYLSKERWKHISQHHPEIVNYMDEIKYTLRKPDKIVTVDFDENIQYYHRFIKHKAGSDKVLLIIVKYINHSGFIITAYFIKHPK